MKKILYTLFIILFLSSCDENYIEHKEIVNTEYVNPTFTSYFSSGFAVSDGEYKIVEYLDTMRIIYFENYFGGSTVYMRNLPNFDQVKTITTRTYQIFNIEAKEDQYNGSLKIAISSDTWGVDGSVGTYYNTNFNSFSYNLYRCIISMIQINANEWKVTLANQYNDEYGDFSLNFSSTTFFTFGTYGGCGASIENVFSLKSAKNNESEIYYYYTEDNSFYNYYCEHILNPTHSGMFTNDMIGLKDKFAIVFSADKEIRQTNDPQITKKSLRLAVIDPSNPDFRFLYSYNPSICDFNNNAVVIDGYENETDIYSAVSMCSNDDFTEGLLCYSKNNTLMYRIIKMEPNGLVQLSQPSVLTTTNSEYSQCYYSNSKYYIVALTSSGFCCAVQN